MVPHGPPGLQHRAGPSSPHQWGCTLRGGAESDVGSAWAGLGAGLAPAPRVFSARAEPDAKRSSIKAHGTAPGQHRPHPSAAPLGTRGGGTAGWPPHGNPSLWLPRRPESSSPLGRGACPTDTPWGSFVSTLTPPGCPSAGQGSCPSAPGPQPCGTKVLGCPFPPCYPSPVLGLPGAPGSTWGPRVPPSLCLCHGAGGQTGCPWALGL